MECFFTAGSSYLWQVIIASAEKKGSEEEKEGIFKGNLVPLDLQVGLCRYWVAPSKRMQKDWVYNQALPPELVPDLQTGAVYPHQMRMEIIGVFCVCVGLFVVVVLWWFFFFFFGEAGMRDSQGWVSPEHPGRKEHLLQSGVEIPRLQRM